VVSLALEVQGVSATGVYIFTAGLLICSLHRTRSCGPHSRLGAKELVSGICKDGAPPLTGCGRAALVVHQCTRAAVVQPAGEPCPCITCQGPRRQGSTEVAAQGSLMICLSRRLMGKGEHYAHTEYTSSDTIISSCLVPCCLPLSAARQRLGAIWPTAGKRTFGLLVNRLLPMSQVA